MTTALIYCRVSQDRANGRSVSEQEAESRAFCEQQGWDIIEVVNDSAGASRHSKGHRDGWERCHAILDRGDADVLVTWEASRAQRDLNAYSKLRDVCARTGTMWAYSGNIYNLDDGDDRFRTGLDVLMAEREAEDTSRRIRRSMRANAATGRPHGRRLFGYERIYDETTGALLGQVPVPAEARIVQRIYAEYLDGEHMTGITERLNVDGLKTSTGKPWHFTAVRRCLTNPAYAGKRVHRGEVVTDAVWEPIVDETMWEQAQDRIEAARSTRTRRAPRARMLTGVARCGLCGAKMNVGHDRKNRKVYQCRAEFHISRDEKMLDAYLTDIVIEQLEMLDVGDLADDRDAGRIADLRREIAAVEGRVQEATELFVAGSITGGTLNRIEEQTKNLIRELRQEIRRLAVPSYIKLPTGPVREWWDAQTPEQRRELCCALLASVTVGPTRRGSRTFDPNAITIEWRI